MIYSIIAALYSILIQINTHILYYTLALIDLSLQSGRFPLSCFRYTLYLVVYKQHINLDKYWYVQSVFGGRTQGLLLFVPGRCVWATYVPDNFIINIF